MEKINNNPNEDYTSPRMTPAIDVDLESSLSYKVMEVEQSPDKYAPNRLLMSNNVISR